MKKMRFYNKTLEFDVILSKIAKYANSKTTEEKITKLKPKFNKEEINNSYLKIDEAREIIIKSGNLPFLADFDIHNIINMLKSKRELSISDLQYIRLFAVMSSKFIESSKNLKRMNVNLTFLKILFDSLLPFNDVIDLIDGSIDYDGHIKDSASEELYNLRKEKQRKISKRDEVLQQALVKRRTILNDSILVMRNNRYCLPIKTEHKNQVKGVVHDISSSGTTTYIEPLEANNLSNELTVIEKSEQQEIVKILTIIASFLYPLYNDFLNNLNIIVELDYYFSAAEFSIKYDCIKPNVNTSGDVYLKNARHPLIDQDDIVPVTIKLSQTKPVLLITGPNTGGKTVSLKTLGLLSLMAQSGLLIPVDENSQVSIFKGIYADIGDKQSIQQSLSTFSSHIKNINEILKNTEPISLILIDELGSGTDPNEGVSLAKAIINYLIKKDSRLVVTTHYSELKVFAYSNPLIENASVRFDEETLAPLYIIDYGKSGSSNAIKIAKRLGVNEEITQTATSFLEDTQTNLDSSIIEFEQKHELLQKKLEDVLNKEKTLEQKNKELENKLEELNKQKENIILRAKQEANIEISKVKQEAESILNKLKETKSEPEIASLKYDLRQLGIKDLEEKPTKDINFKVGDTVYIKTYQQVGKIIDVKNNKYLVKFGIFELEFNKLDLAYSDKQKLRSKEIKKEVTTSYKTSYTINATNKLDLRGFRYEEVEELYKQFIDQAIMANLKELQIIHGFGTGAVRNALYEQLKKDKNVDTYRFGGEHEGLNGVTIVTLKD